MVQSTVPTLKNLAAHKCAVVFVTKSSQDPDDDSQTDYEFDWFDRPTQVDYYLDEIGPVFEDMAASASSIYSLVATVLDTDNMTLGVVKVYHPDNEEATAYCADWAQKVADDPSRLLTTEEEPKKTKAAPKTKAKVASAKVSQKVERKVKGRKPSAAAAAASSDDTNALVTPAVMARPKAPTRRKV